MTTTRPTWAEADAAISEAAHAVARHYRGGYTGGLAVLVDRLACEDPALVIRVARELTADIARRATDHSPATSNVQLQGES